jgi:hypothetical protein
MTPKTKLRAIMAAVTGACSLIGFQFFIMFLMRGWRFFPVEASIALAVGGLMGWAAFPKSVGKCVKVGIITGLAAGYALVILMGKKV